VKIIRTILILFFSINILFSSPYSKEINSLYKKIPYASKQQTIEIMHELENLYINSVISDDKKGIEKSLKGIIKCQKLLNIDSTTYQSELASLTNKPPKSTIKPLPVQTKEVSQSVKINKNSILSIKSIKQKNNTIIIKFNAPITRKQMLFFEINRNGIYKDIYDLKANLNFKTPKIALKTIKNIKIAQNRVGKVRIVLEDEHKIYSNAFIREGTLFISIQKNPDHKIVTTKPIIKKETTPSKSSPKTEKNKIYASSKIIVIDPGHGGSDPGAVGYKRYKEKITVLKISKTLKSILEKKGYKVYLTRDKDRFIKLSQRTKFANKKEADLFISIHANASPSKTDLSLKGIETFFLSPAKTEKAKRIAAKENKSAVVNLNDMSKNTLLSFLNKTKIVQSNKLAIDIQKGMLTQVRKKHKGVRDGGVREAPFWVLVGAQMPAVLVELGYITNPTEADRLFNPFYQKSLAKGIADGINNYFVHNNY